MNTIKFPYIYHSHTKRCGHAYGEDIEIIETAIKNGVKVLCVTDHTPIPGYSQPGVRMEVDQIDEYVSTWKKYQEQFKDQITIYLGLEVEYSIEHHDYIKYYLINKELDFLVFGEHCYEIGGKVYWSNSTYNGTRSLEDLRDSYVQQLCDAMNKGLITYLAHPDCFIVGQKCFDENVEVSCRKLIETAIKNDVIIEYNVHGIYNHHLSEFGYPNDYFWKLVKKDYPNAKITIGLDCHSLTEYGNNELLNQALNKVKELNLKIIDTIDIKSHKDRLYNSWNKQ